jgi:hypothetical protein
MIMLPPFNHHYYYLFALVPLSVLAIRGLCDARPGLIVVVAAAYMLMSPPIPFGWLDRHAWLPAPSSYLANYFNLPIAGALLVWIVVTRELIEDGRGGWFDATWVRWWVRWRFEAIVTVVALVAAAFGVRALRAAPAPSPVTVDLRLDPPASPDAAALAVSPDARFIVYIASRDDGGRLLCVRRLEDSTSGCRADVGRPSAPFISPDARWIAFFDDGVLTRVRTAGGPVEAVRGAPAGGQSGNWSSDGTIVMAGVAGIHRVPESGGAAERLVKARPGTHFAWPIIVRASQTLIYTTHQTNRSMFNGQIVAQSLRDGREQYLQMGSHASYDERSGALVYALGGRVLAARFNPETFVFPGVAVPLVANVAAAEGGLRFAVGEGGVVLYEIADGSDVKTRLLTGWRSTLNR